MTTTTTTIVVDRFTYNGDGTVTDNDSGLIWLKDADCLGAMNWENAISTAGVLASRSCGLQDGSDPGDWRLPTIEEWEAFVCREYFSPAVCSTAGRDQWSEDNPFNNVLSRSYWASTEYEYDRRFAWMANLDNGDMLYDNRASNIISVWPVREP